MAATERSRLSRFFRALGLLIAGIASAFWKLITGTRVSRSPRSRTEVLDLSGTGGRYNARTGNYDNGQDPYGTYPDDDRRL